MQMRTFIVNFRAATGIIYYCVKCSPQVAESETYENRKRLDGSLRISHAARILRHVAAEIIK